MPVAGVDKRERTRAPGEWLQEFDKGAALKIFLHDKTIGLQQSRTGARKCDDPEKVA